MSPPQFELPRARTVVTAVKTGWRLFRQHGPAIRRARGFCLVADVLTLRQPRDWQRRADRFYGRASRGLATIHPGDPVHPGDPDPGRRAHRLLCAAQAPYRRMALAIGAAAAALAAAIAVVVLIACALSPALRGRLFPPDLAARRPWVASSTLPPNPQSGTGPSTGTRGLFFHTQPSDHPWLQIDLGVPRVIRRLRIDNRSDCCEERALPINLEVFDSARGQWRIVAQRRSYFTVWTHRVDPVRAQRVRVRLAGVGILHLKRISLYEW